MIRLLSPLRHALWAGFLVGFGAEAQDAGPLPRFTLAAGGTRLGFPEVLVPSASAATGSARLLLKQRGAVFAVATAQLVVPLSVTAIEASCPPTADCVGTTSPSSLVGGAVGVGRTIGDKLMVAGHLGTLRAAGLEGGGPARRATLAADLSWKLASRRAAPVVGLTAVSFLGRIAGSRGYVAPTLGFAW